jgi:hypothetical protein
MNISVTEGFSKWAKGFSGCRGNINGTIWFCGIEYGGNESEEKFQFDNVAVPADVSNDDERESLLAYQYNKKIAKIYASIIGEDVSNYSQIALRDKLFAKGSCVFTTNLYPISFHHDSNYLWPEWLYGKTGLPTKSMYRAWCQLHRFPEMKNWVREHSPKIIISTGISYKNEFVMAFDGVETIYKKKIIEKPTISDRRLFWIDINENKTLLVIIPFLGGRYGLNSDSLLDDFGKYLKQQIR